MYKGEEIMPKSDGYKNLIPANKRSKDEARKLGQKGGIKSGEVRRMRKTLKEHLLLLLSEKSVQEDICLAIIDKALDGDTKAFQIIRDTIGEKPTENLCISSVNMNLQKSYDEVKALIEAERQKLITKNRHEIPLIEYNED